jgi:hypothetical protein
MPSSTSQALLEAAHLLQAFVAALESWQITSLLHLPYSVYNFMYSHLLPSARPPTPHLSLINKTIPPSIKSLAPLLAFLLLYTTLVQIRLTSPSRHLTLRLELLKSAIVTALWLWLLISSVVGYWGNPYYRLVNCVLSFLFIWSVYLLFRGCCNLFVVSEKFPSPPSGIWWVGLNREC